MEMYWVRKITKKKIADTKASLLKITTDSQVLQNKVNILLTNAKYDTPTENLLKETNSLSVQQMIAYHSALLAYKVVKSGKPSYIKERLKSKTCSMSLRGQSNGIIQRNYKLSISKEGFI